MRNVTWTPLVAAALDPDRGAAEVIPGVKSGRGILETARDLAYVQAMRAGLGPELAVLAGDSQTSDIVITHGQVWVDRGGGMQRASADLGDEADVRALAVRMAAACGKRLDDASPIVDGVLPAGIRLHAVIPPISGDGTAISLRIQRERAWSVDELAGAGMFPAGLIPFLTALVDQRANVVITGATGCGKTTLLASLLGLVVPTERILVIEESAEVHPDHPHVVHLQERRPNVQGSGAVSESELVRAAMRMRPDRLVLGECRGSEVREVLTALNTGHSGGWMTLHANGVAQVPARLLALGAMAGMSEAALAAQACAALDVIVHLERGPSGVRRLTSIGVIQAEQGLQAAVAFEVFPRPVAGVGFDKLLKGRGEAEAFLEQADDTLALHCGDGDRGAGSGGGPERGPDGGRSGNWLSEGEQRSATPSTANPHASGSQWESLRPSFELSSRRPS